MFAMKHPNAVTPVREPDTAIPSEPWENHTARFTAEWGPSFVVITAHGELDASNANHLADYVQRSAAHSKSIILNLTGLEFFGTAGFSALHTLYVNRTLLPPEVRPNWFMQAGILFCGVFFFLLSLMTLIMFLTTNNAFLRLFSVVLLASLVGLGVQSYQRPGPPPQLDASREM